MSFQKMFFFKIQLVVFSLIIFLSCTVNEENKNFDDETLSKIKFSLEDFNGDGLYGEPDGLRAMDYKFCIPKNEKLKEMVLNIDQTINVTEGKENKNGCDDSEYLCIGNTHKKDFKVILSKIASLDFVAKIEHQNWE